MLWMLLQGCGDALITKGQKPEAASWPTARLVEVGELPEGAQVVDAREAEAFAAGHIPGALQANWRELADFDADGLWAPAEREEATALLAERGLLAGEGPIVVYDDWSDEYYGGDGYLYWTLRHLGVEDVRLLHGGWTTWVAAGGEVDDGTLAPGDFVGGEGADVLATTEEVAAASERGAPLLLDVRSVSEWEAGHVPGAVHFEWDAVLDAGLLRSPDEIAELLADVGLDEPDEPVITYCAGGIRAGQTFFVLELMGFGAVQDYVGSWTAWSASGGAVAVP